MSVDPTPTAENLDPQSKEAVRGGTRTRFNLWVLLASTALVVAALFGAFAVYSGRMGSTREDIGRTTQDAAVFDADVQPAKGDSPVDGESVNPENSATTPSQENPGAQ